ncbi:MAG: hypothetical protein GY798_01150 [Hyphomicrobiales bacterium]|nr:hypothetical protein [Hyphomicrobiales bacterium]
MQAHRISIALLVFCGMAFVTASANAQDSARTVEQFTCKEVMASPEAGRDIAIAFLHGYLLGKSGSSSFDIETLNGHSDNFIDKCLDNPTDVAVEVMMSVKE